MAPFRRVVLQFTERHPNIVVLTVFAYISLTFGGLLLGGVWAYRDSRAQRNQIARNAEQSHRALCAYREDLSLRVEASKAFLADNPRGIPGISRAVIVTNIANQQRTIDALRFLNCVETP